MSLSTALKQRALEIGFDLVGVAPLAAWKDLEFSRRWVEKGFGGEMGYLANPRRDDPRKILPSVQSVICVGLTYNASLPYSEEVRGQESGVRSQKSEVGCRSTEEAPHSSFQSPSAVGSRSDGQRTTDDGPRAWISRYAWGRDYHEVMRAKLEALRTEIEQLAPAVETRVYADTGPIVERAFARYSGIGWTGKNTCLINEQKGSWFFLGVVLSSLALEPDLPAPDRCGSCTRCLDACPTGALVEPYVMDASRCIAYLNIELKGSIPAEFRAAIGDNVFGCDICQDVCPWNSRSSDEWRVTSGEHKNSPMSQAPGPSRAKGYGREGAATTTLAEFQPMEIDLMRPQALRSQRTTDDGPRASGRVSSAESRFSLFNPPLETLAAMTEEDFRRAFRDSPIKRAKFRGWLRNLSVAMGNSGDARFIPRLRELAAHSDPVVREHAEWALKRLHASANPPIGTAGQ